MASKQQKAASLVRKVRQEFPRPVTSSEQYHATGKTYCVGGAFVSYLNGNVPFPGTSEIGGMLARQNPALSDGADTLPYRVREYVLRGLDDFDKDQIMGRDIYAEDGIMSIGEAFGFAIIEANDEGRFTRAWNLAERALAYKAA